MPVKSEFNPDFLYFVTTKAVNYLHIFRSNSVKRILVDSFHFLRTSGRVKLCVFVVMPNHIHMIARFSKDYGPPDLMRDFKRHTARQILRELMAEHGSDELALLQTINRDRRQDYKIWEDNYDSRDIYSMNFLQQKMDYIHLNPCQPQWKLVDDPVEYVWSSARYYMADQPAIIPLDNVREYLV
jgi:putative transposase